MDVPANVDVYTSVPARVDEQYYYSSVCCFPGCQERFLGATQKDARLLAVLHWGRAHKMPLQVIAFSILRWLPPIDTHTDTLRWLPPIDTHRHFAVATAHRHTQTQAHTHTHARAKSVPNKKNTRQVCQAVADHCQQYQKFQHHTGSPAAIYGVYGQRSGAPAPMEVALGLDHDQARIAKTAISNLLIFRFFDFSTKRLGW